MSDLSDRKRALRRELRALRRSVSDGAERSERIWERVRAIPAVVDARTVMAFDPVPGEPDAATFIEWCRAQGKTVVVPANERDAEPPEDLEHIDVVIVPGLAFTADGDRLGQGGGWYDRVLRELRPDCLTIGVGFEQQLVDELPVELHDVRLDIVVTDAGVAIRPA